MFYIKVPEIVILVNLFLESSMPDSQRYLAIFVDDDKKCVFVVSLQ